MSPRADKRRSRRRLPAVELLLPLACFVSLLVLASSEFVTTFQLVNPGGETLDPTGGVGVSGAERHSYAMFVIAFFALFFLALSALTGSKPAAVAVAVAGGLALLLFLLMDLPDAGREGPVSEPVFLANAEVVPQAGFWLELMGALGLAVAGAALATLTPDQLALGERFEAWRNRRAEAAAEGPRPKDEGDEAKPSPKRRRPIDAEEGPRRERVSERVARVRRAASRRRGAD